VGLDAGDVVLEVHNGGLVVPHLARKLYDLVVLFDQHLVLELRIGGLPVHHLGLKVHDLVVLTDPHGNRRKR